MSLVIGAPVVTSWLILAVCTCFVSKVSNRPVMARGNGPTVRISPCGVNPRFSLQVPDPGTWAVTRDLARSWLMAHEVAALANAVPAPDVHLAEILTIDGSDVTL